MNLNMSSSLDLFKQRELVWSEVKNVGAPQQWLPKPQSLEADVARTRITR
jgi:hypothetical protein